MLLSSLLKREPFTKYLDRCIQECTLIGIQSVFIVVLISLFIGAVTTVQTAYNLVNPFVPKHIIGTIVRDMTLLELAPTFTAVIFAGKVGSNIASELGTMRITEQIDAIEVMGINAASYLVLPKVLASLLVYPLLVILAGFCSISGGYLITSLLNLMTPEEYIYGIRSGFVEFNAYFALIKSFLFAFLISSIASYKGFFTQGGALEVGKASTQTVTTSCITLLLIDFLLAKLLV